MANRLGGSTGLAGFAALLLGGCATITALTRVPITLPPPPPEARAALAPVTGIMIEPPNWGALPETPWARGASPVTGGGMLTAMQSGCVGAVVSPSTLLAPWFVPFTCAGGAATGSVGSFATGAASAEQARTPEQVETARVAFSAAVATMNSTSDLGARLLARSGHDGVPLLLACPAAAGCATDDGRAPSAWLWLAVQPAFASAGAFNPEVTLFVTVRGRVLDAAGSELAWRCWRYRSPAVSYFALADDDAARLKAELNWAWKAMATRIADDIFLASADVMLLPAGRSGEAMPLSAAGAHVESGELATRGVLQAALDAPDRPPVSAGGFDCLGP
jgi:hypothetical protein